MKEIEIKHPNGYLFDSDGKVCIRFGGWETGVRTVPDFVDGSRQPEYVDGPAAHSKSRADKYRRSVE